MSDSRLAEAVELSFGRHETFAPRFGWLHKAYTRVKDDSEIFHREDAPVRLGVGKNMVYSMRYWSKAFKLTQEHEHEEPSYRAHVASPTWRARWLLDEEGADPYLEDTGSLWLLHWWLLSSEPQAKCWVPSWYVMFNLAHRSRVTSTEMASVITRHVRENFEEGDWPAPESIGRDAECLIKMYALDQEFNPLSPGSFEDLLLSPFRELRLLEGQGKGRNRTWRFTSGSRSNLPAPVLAYACLDYASRSSSQAGSISIARLAEDPGSPGRAFRMREPELTKALEPLINEHPDLQIISALGQRSLRFDVAPQALAWNVLDEHYGRVREREGFPSPQEWIKKYPGLDGDAPKRARRKPPQQTEVLEMSEETA
ncbi:DUF4007 family protein [Streptomyces sp. Je 1-4]|uniref:DUF4007 family protein n=1 Tax=Streptomyces TaxID=1883 RepID=UPI0021D9A40F|nr:MULTISPECIES: DUF4007 family protein [unclassified Streptomyces]UYB40874.1 DUF4007 family protein [Streptomyces sp. Je 1-4]UZQ37033.1 DUF4007 family protein [Streptomyces sp. Je 1-4] [Streptomyces sp. Je 1-4 4N24]UZQ44450.1 DUF4007 family protein [Streptomyces sp. Je 1-4] [Streptomyces sp. Je 1-4 4N24_ara]